MNKFKIYVYAICKNEEKFAKKWMQSMSEADGVYVLDTGSDDDTVKILRECGAIVNTEKISPWRFDTARNRSLTYVPDDADICVCTDLDELFEPNWRKLLENSWTKQTDCASYRYTWNFNEDGSEGYVFAIEKIHSRENFIWENAVHEVLKFTKPRAKRCVFVSGIQLNHYADTTKGRGQYLPLLEKSVEENPNDDRNMHYLGREYMYYSRWRNCIDTLKKHLNMPSATWKDERAASMRYIAKSYAELKKYDTAEIWFFKSIAEAPHLREPYVDFALFLYQLKQWEGVVFMCEKALKITCRTLSYINEAAAWGILPFDLAAIAHYNLNNLQKALSFTEKALEISPNENRLIKNRELYLKEIDKQKPL